MKHLVCVGLGYSARAVADRLAGDPSWRITGTARSARSAADITSGTGRVTGVAFDGTEPSAALAAALGEATHVLVSAAPDSSGDPLLNRHRADIAGAKSLAWIGYLSTIGVYGDHDGRWIDETAELRPVSQRSRQRVAAEDAWMALARESGARLQIFRLAGIYGPGRSAIDKVLDGTARRIIKPGQVFNRIHVTDIANAVLAGLSGAGTHTVYNVTDDEPAPPQDVIAHAAHLLGLPVPPDIPFEDANLSAMGRSFYGELKRVKNERMKSDLGVRLSYPSYREGLAALASGIRSPDAPA